MQNNIYVVKFNRNLRYMRLLAAELAHRIRSRIVIPVGVQTVLAAQSGIYLRFLYIYLVPSGSVLGSLK